MVTELPREMRMMDIDLRNEIRRSGRQEIVQLAEAKRENKFEKLESSQGGEG